MLIFWYNHYVEKVFLLFNLLLNREGSHLKLPHRGKNIPIDFKAEECNTKHEDSFINNVRLKFCCRNSDALNQVCCAWSGNYNFCQSLCCQCHPYGEENDEKSLLHPNVNIVFHSIAVNIIQCLGQINTNNKEDANVSYQTKYEEFQNSFGDNKKTVFDDSITGLSEIQMLCNEDFTEECTNTGESSNSNSNFEVSHIPRHVELNLSPDYYGSYKFGFNVANRTPDIDYKYSNLLTKIQNLRYEKLISRTKTSFERTRLSTNVDLKLTTGAMPYNDYSNYKSSLWQSNSVQKVLKVSENILESSYNPRENISLVNKEHSYGDSETGLASKADQTTNSPGENQDIQNRTSEALFSFSHGINNIKKSDLSCQISSNEKHSGIKSEHDISDSIFHKANSVNKKVFHEKLDWSTVNSRCGSFLNIHHIPGGGKNSTIFHEKQNWSLVKSKCGSFDNIKHVPGGGQEKIYHRKSNYSMIKSRYSTLPTRMNIQKESINQRKESCQNEGKATKEDGENLSGDQSINEHQMKSIYGKRLYLSKVKPKSSVDLQASVIESNAMMQSTKTETKANKPIMNEHQMKSIYGKQLYLSRFQPKAEYENLCLNDTSAKKSEGLKEYGDKHSVKVPPNNVSGETISNSYIQKNKSSSEYKINCEKMTPSQMKSVYGKRFLNSPSGYYKYDKHARIVSQWNPEQRENSLNSVINVSDDFTRSRSLYKPKNIPDYDFVGCRSIYKPGNSNQPNKSLYVTERKVKLFTRSYVQQTLMFAKYDPIRFAVDPSEELSNKQTNETDYNYEETPVEDNENSEPKTVLSLVLKKSTKDQNVSKKFSGEENTSDNKSGDEKTNENENLTTENVSENKEPEIYSDYTEEHSTIALPNEEQIVNPAVEQHRDDHSNEIDKELNTKKCCCCCSIS